MCGHRVLNLHPLQHKLAMLKVPFHDFEQDRERGGRGRLTIALTPNGCEPTIRHQLSCYWNDDIKLYQTNDKIIPLGVQEGQRGPKDEEGRGPPRQH